MEPMSLHVGRIPQQRTPPDDFAEDVLIEMANLDERDTNIAGTIFVSTALGAHGPRNGLCHGLCQRAGTSFSRRPRESPLSSSSR